jgi:uncharacterized protein (DUF1330 family)
MPAYILADVEITDPARWEDYRSKVGETITQYGGKTLVRNNNPEVLEGDLRPHLLVIVEFQTLAQAKRWYSSEEYKPVLALRKIAATTQVVLVEGL